jgi:FAD dependent oxidoreductase
MEFDVAVVGASAGGFAAALAAAEGGAHTVLLCSGEWPGGQLTSEGVPTPDEQQYIETFGGTRRYMRFRNAVRSHYRTFFPLSPAAANAQYLNPGACWVSRLSYEPAVGAQVLMEMAKEVIASGHLVLLRHANVVAARMEGPRIASITACIQGDGEAITRDISATWYLDGTDTGDLLALCGEEGVDWVTGAESRLETGEPDAPQEARPHWVQPFTFPFALDWYPEGKATNTIEPPYDYEELKRQQNYHVIHGAITGLFAGRAPWWSYRRILASQCFLPGTIASDIAMINTAGNDFYGGSNIGRTAHGNPVTPSMAAEALARARRASLGYIYWLQTECVRTEEDLRAAPNGGADTATAGQKGYPEFRLRKDLFGTEDGLAPEPYIRESRRIKALATVLEQDIVVADFSGKPCRGSCARATHFPDSVGIGHYALDIHPNGHGEPNHYVPTRPFQIPLGALIPIRLQNYLPACKNLGVTHLTNGAYRLHPIEWNIGESAGLLAAHCLASGDSPRDVLHTRQRLRQFQGLLLSQGVALNWYVDVPEGHPAFEAVQMLACAGLQPGQESDLLFRPDESITLEEWTAWMRALNVPQVPPFQPQSRAQAAIKAAEYLL